MLRYFIFVGVKDVFECGQVQLVTIQFGVFFGLANEQVDDLLDFRTRFGNGLDLAEQVYCQVGRAGLLLFLQFADILSAPVDCLGQHLRIQWRTSTWSRIA